MTSTIKVDNIQDQDGNNIINENANTITIGASGDTVTLASGASQSGFGREGSVDWQTGSIKTATFTATNGEGYFANTSGGAFTMNLPAGSPGNIVSVVDYTNTFQTNNLTITPNGSQKIGGIAAPNTLSTEGQSVTFVYVDDTEGWKNVQDSTSNVTGSPFIVASGGTITTCGNCKIHTFTGPGTFCVSTVATNAANNQVSYMVVAGGASGGGGADSGAGGGAGGGGAGGFREDKSPVTPYTASPLEGAGPITVTATAFPITVGAGGATQSSSSTGGSNGSNSIFSTITSAGGGSGGAGYDGITYGSGGGGGSGGGAGASNSSVVGTGTGGPGNNPPVSPPQGNNGGTVSGTGIRGGGGGGGASASGSSGASSPSAGPGGAGVSSSISGSSVGRAGGGGGGQGNGNPGGTVSDGGGSGGGTDDVSGAANAGTANTGGGGGGGGDASSSFVGAAGGSGIVIIRYKFQ